MSISNSLIIIVFCAVIRAGSTAKIYMHLNSPERLYSFFPIETDYIEFQVKAAREIHIALTVWPNLGETYNQYYEMVLDGADGSLSLLRKGSDGNVVATHTGSIVEPNGFATYWIQKNSTEGSINFGKGKGTVSIMSFVDPEYVETNYLGASTAQGVDAIWIINTNTLDSKD